MRNKEGAFSIYKDTELELVGFRELQNIKIPFMMFSNFKSGGKYENIYLESKRYLVASNRTGLAPG
jgi:hypothetical protein